MDGVEQHRLIQKWSWQSRIADYGKTFTAGDTLQLNELAATDLNKRPARF
jgi:hypothetical protein